jgi:hypothetical protein
MTSLTLDGSSVLDRFFMVTSPTQHYQLDNNEQYETQDEKRKPVNKESHQRENNPFFITIRIRAGYERGYPEIAIENGAHQPGQNRYQYNVTSSHDFSTFPHHDCCYGRLRVVVCILWTGVPPGVPGLGIGLFGRGNVTSKGLIAFRSD